jgi:hypothetical protein
VLGREIEEVQDGKGVELTLCGYRCKGGYEGFVNEVAGDGF